MYYNRLNENGKTIALALAAEAGLTGKVTRELAPNGEKYAFFKLSHEARGDAVSATCTQLERAGFDPDVLFGYGYTVVRGGFIGKSFSDKATEYTNRPKD